MKLPLRLPFAALLGCLLFVLPADAQRAGSRGSSSSGSFGGARGGSVRVTPPPRPSSFGSSSTSGASRGTSPSYRPAPISSGSPRVTTPPARPVYVPPVSSAPPSSAERASSPSRPSGSSLGLGSPTPTSTSTSTGSSSRPGSSGQWGPNRVLDASALTTTESAEGEASRGDWQPAQPVRFPSSYTSTVYARRAAEDDRLRSLAGGSDGARNAGNPPTDSLSGMRRSAPSFTQASLQRVFARGAAEGTGEASRERDAEHEVYRRGPVERLAVPNTALERISSWRSSKAVPAPGSGSTLADPEPAVARAARETARAVERAQDAVVGHLMRVPPEALRGQTTWRPYEGPEDPIHEYVPQDTLWAYGVGWSLSSSWSSCSPCYGWSWCYSWPLWYCHWWYQPVVPIYLPTYGYGYGYGPSAYEAVYAGGGGTAMEVEEAVALGEDGVLDDTANEVGEGVAGSAFGAGQDPAARLAAAERFLTLGDRAFREERYQDAVQFYSKAVDLMPEEGVLHMILADALFATGDYHWAAAQIRRALDLDPNLVDTDLDKREFYLDATEFDRQLATLELYLRDHPTDSDARVVLALNLLYGQRPVAVLEVLEDEQAYALRADPAAVLIKAAAGRRERF